MLRKALDLLSEYALICDLLFEFSRKIVIFVRLFGRMKNDGSGDILKNKNNTI